MLFLTADEMALKMGKLQQLSDAITRARLSGEIVERPSGGRHRKYTPQQAVEMAHLYRQYNELYGTLPKLRVVA